MLLDDDCHSIDSPNMAGILENVKFPNSIAASERLADSAFSAMG
jgi:hypothetical protein